MNPSPQEIPTYIQSVMPISGNFQPSSATLNNSFPPIRNDIIANQLASFRALARQITDLLHQIEGLIHQFRDKPGGTEFIAKFLTASQIIDCGHTPKPHQPLKPIHALLLFLKSIQNRPAMFRGEILAP